jgi:hypothetical protein
MAQQSSHHIPSLNAGGGFGAAGLMSEPQHA